MIVYYFGADAPWANQKEIDINRRNMAVLLVIAEQPKVNVVYNIIRCTRGLVLNKKNQKRSSHTKIKNLYVGAILPERGALKSIVGPLNKHLLRILNYKAFNSKNSVSWCYWPNGYLDYKFLGLNNRLVFDTDHNIINDPNLPEHQKENRARLLLEAGKNAEIVLSSSRSMIDWYKKKGFNNTKIMMNGVFDSRINLETNIKLDNNYQVTYCGTLSKWIKIDWIIRLAQDHPEWSINIIGRNYKTELYTQLEQFKNIKLHGFLKPMEVDKILKETNVCIGLYREEVALDVNSMKLYDYLAQGLPVVVNNYHDNLAQDFNNLIHVEDNYNDFIETIQHVKTIDFDKLKYFLNGATWYNRVKSIIKSIDE
ncbi:glycosyltransferase [Psychroserpens sp. Hel_I_66]|uniref:glycosyltransferase n=1 Tax=Psychroserpens sp. Hel_I_66 TaxID=1250004 RepID=UPI000647E9B6|nr:glycosyltransferase [Psychroserpens sp. Hel_I_66]